MPRRKQSKGVCSYCGQEFAKAGMAKHLPICPQRQAAIAKAEQSKVAAETLYQLRAQADGLSDFWLDLEMRGTAKLKDLDHYLRAIWLECCGHLSQFSLGGWGGDEIAMSRSMEQVMTPNTELTHIYDFGTESVTLIKCVTQRNGKPTTRHPIALLARNLQPEAQCIECKNPATRLCMECLIEADVWGVLCDEHAETHPHDNYGEPIRLVNSPRLGLCGYEGPATPPY